MGQMELEETLILTAIMEETSQVLRNKEKASSKQAHFPTPENTDKNQSTSRVGQSITSATELAEIATSCTLYYNAVLMKEGFQKAEIKLTFSSI